MNLKIQASHSPALVAAEIRRVFEEARLRFDGALAETKAIPLAPPQCSRCTSPATVPSLLLGIGPMCVYCAHATAHGRRDPADQDALVASSVFGERENMAARSEREANERRLRPTSTASRRELAKAHPWEEF